MPWIYLFAFQPDNPRTTAPADVGGSVKVASFNVLNYFTTIDLRTPDCGPAADQDCRGADSTDELARQTAKIVAALKEIDADIFGLIELENNASALLQTLALNEEGARPYAFVDIGDLNSYAMEDPITEFKTYGYKRRPITVRVHQC